MERMSYIIKPSMLYIFYFRLKGNEMDTHVRLPGYFFMQKSRESKWAEIFPQRLISANQKDAFSLFIKLINNLLH